jgi:hypothetical protein
MSPRPFSLLLLIAAGFSLFTQGEIRAGASNKNGNPFGNGTFFQTTGTFSAVIRGQNLSGTMLFSSGVPGAAGGGGTNSTASGSTGASLSSGSTASLSGSSGSCVISYLGSSDGATQPGESTPPGVYYGNASGMWDPSSGQITGQFWGGYTLSGTNSTRIYPEVYNNSNNPLSPAGPFPFLVPIVTNQIQPAVVVVTNSTLTVVGTNADGSTIISTNITISTINVGTTNVLYTNLVSVMPVGTNSFQDSVMMNGNFDGHVQNKYPNQTFSAQGMISQQQLYPQQISSDSGSGAEGTIPVQLTAPLMIPVSVQGIRVADTYTSFNTISNAVPYSITTYTITNVPSQQGGL